jgi:hypothetical protein
MFVAVLLLLLVYAALPGCSLTVQPTTQVHCTGIAQVQCSTSMPNNCCFALFAAAAAAAADTMEGLTMSTPEQQDATTLNVAGRAYKRIMSWMIGARMTSLTRNSNGVWVAALVRSAAAAAATEKPSRSWVVWNGDERVSSQLFVAPAAWKVSSSQSLLTGAVSSASSAVVTDVPVLLT